ncbi:type II restriction endonuclease [Pseudomonas monteilii]|uniref:type II restriction endonuclease n=1 Tax=Pseudomonas monteilii TaxID=76759 RepID=UPI00383B50C1
MGWSEIHDWLLRSERVFIKKLSRNDTSWADTSDNGHQNGFYIPRKIAESDFFPALKNINPDKPHIFEAEYDTLWPASSEIKTSMIKYFSLRNPGVAGKEKPRYEWHHTGVPKEQFRGVSPASLLLVGKLARASDGVGYWCMVVDSVSDEAEIIETEFKLGASFHFGFYDPLSLAKPASESDQLVADLLQALNQGQLEQFIASQQFPSPEILAKQAQAAWLKESGEYDMNPFEIKNPGDAVMRISRDIEYSLYKRAELKFRAAQVAKIIMRADGHPIANLVREFHLIDSIFLSAAQTRKSRAGRSFEQHVERLLRDANVNYEAQVVFGGRRPDFVLPDIRELNEKGDAVILSLKTTLRERWKQLALEKPLGAIFLATVDDRVSAEAVDEMERNSITLVVPESLKKKSNESVYYGRGNVITFKEFFDFEIKNKRPTLVCKLPA